MCEKMEKYKHRINTKVKNMINLGCVLLFLTVNGILSNDTNENLQNLHHLIYNSESSITAAISSEDRRNVIISSSTSVYQLTTDPNNNGKLIVYNHPTSENLDEHHLDAKIKCLNRFTGSIGRQRCIDRVQRMSFIENSDSYVACNTNSMRPILKKYYLYSSDTDLADNLVLQKEKSFDLCGSSHPDSSFVSATSKINNKKYQSSSGHLYFSAHINSDLKKATFGLFQIPEDSSEDFTSLVVHQESDQRIFEIGSTKLIAAFADSNKKDNDCYFWLFFNAGKYARVARFDGSEFLPEVASASSGKAKSTDESFDKKIETDSNLKNYWPNWFILDLYCDLAKNLKLSKLSSVLKIKREFVAIFSSEDDTLSAICIFTEAELHNMFDNNPIYGNKREIGNQNLKNSFGELSEEDFDSEMNAILGGGGGDDKSKSTKNKESKKQPEPDWLSSEQFYNKIGIDSFSSGSQKITDSINSRSIINNHRFIKKSLSSNKKWWADGKITAAYSGPLNTFFVGDDTGKIRIFNEDYQLSHTTTKLISTTNIEKNPFKFIQVLVSKNSENLAYLVAIFDKSFEIYPLSGENYCSQAVSVCRSSTRKNMEKCCLDLNPYCKWQRLSKYPSYSVHPSFCQSGVVGFGLLFILLTKKLYHSNYRK